MTHANGLPQQILAYAQELEEGHPLTAKALLHLGNRAAVDQALARLARQGELLRVSRGVYVRPVATRFGKRAPSVERIVEGLERSFGETVVPHGAAAANRLGLTTQVPVRPVFLTSGRSRRLTLGNLAVELRHAPPSLLACPRGAAGEAVRALWWMGPEQGERATRALRLAMPPQEQKAFAGLRNIMPGWMAKSASQALVNG